MSYFLCPELRPFIIIILMSHPFVMHLIMHMFNTSMIPYISLDQYLKPQFIHYTKYAKYAFLLLFSIFDSVSRRKTIYEYLGTLSTEKWQSQGLLKLLLRENPAMWYCCITLRKTGPLKEDDLAQASQIGDRPFRRKRLLRKSINKNICP